MNSSNTQTNPNDSNEKTAPLDPQQTNANKSTPSPGLAQDLKVSNNKIVTSPSTRSEKASLSVSLDFGNNNYQRFLYPGLALPPISYQNAKVVSNINQQNSSNVAKNSQNSTNDKPDNPNHPHKDRIGNGHQMHFTTAHHNPLHPKTTRIMPHPKDNISQSPNKSRMASKTQTQTQGAEVQVRNPVDTLALATRVQIEAQVRSQAANVQAILQHAQVAQARAYNLVTQSHLQAKTAYNINMYHHNHLNSGFYQQHQSQNTYQPIYTFNQSHVSGNTQFHSNNVRSVSVDTSSLATVASATQTLNQVPIQLQHPVRRQLPDSSSSSKACTSSFHQQQTHSKIEKKSTAIVSNSTVELAKKENSSTSLETQLPSLQQTRTAMNTKPAQVNQIKAKDDTTNNTRKLYTQPAPNVDTQTNKYPLITLKPITNLTKAQIATLPVVFAYKLGDGGTSESIAIAKSIKYKEDFKTALTGNKNGSSSNSLKAAKKRKEERETLALEGNIKQYGNKIVSKKQDPLYPKGWMIELVERRAGDTIGRMDKYWYSPITKRKFRSRLEIRRFLDMLSHSQGDEDLAYKYLKQPYLLKNENKKVIQSKNKTEEEKKVDQISLSETPLESEAASDRHDDKFVKNRKNDQDSLTKNEKVSQSKKSISTKRILTSKKEALAETRKRFKLNNVATPNENKLLNSVVQKEKIADSELTNTKKLTLNSATFSPRSSNRVIKLPERFHGEKQIKEIHPKKSNDVTENGLVSHLEREKKVITHDNNQSFFGPAPNMPKGWALQIIPISLLVREKLWYSPVEKFKFRTKNEVNRFLILLNSCDGNEKKAYTMRSSGKN